MANQTVQYISQTLILAATLLSATPFAVAEPEAAPADDGYCDYVKGVASAESALMFSPELFGSIGDIEQASIANGVNTTYNDYRVVAGVRYSFNRLYAGFLTRQRAEADCQRHRAFVQITQNTDYEALNARAKVLDAALPEADALLKTTLQDVDARRASAQEALATRLRVEELRSQVAKTKQDMQKLPVPSGTVSYAGALADYDREDAREEAKAGQLRKAQAWDLSVRFGYDRLIDRDVTSPYFVLLSASFNVGWLFQGSGNERAAAGRHVMAKESQGVMQDMTADRLRATLNIETKRLEENGALVADLEKQISQLKQLSGDTTRRYRETVWFEWVKAKAEQEYLTAHVRTLREILGGL